jgi:DNA processing protein
MLPSPGLRWVSRPVWLLDCPPACCGGLIRRMEFSAPLSPISKAGHFPAQVSQAIVKKEAFKRAEKELAGIQKIAGCSLLNRTEPEYPQTLLQIYDPLVLLYVRGDAQVLNLPSLGILGTRRPTLYGTQLAQRLGRGLATRGLVIVSGMARGIDAIVHQGAMDAHGPAIGVLGTGIDVCYPKENKKLYEKVLERGAIISEFPLRAPHRCGHAARGGGGGRRAIQRVADHRAAGHGVR